MTQQVEEKIKTQRSEKLRNIAENIKAEYRKRFIGKYQTVLVEKTNGTIAQGYSENYIQVKFSGNNLKKNQFYCVKITNIDQNDDFSLIGVSD
jgi:threonylcarbamoyladenosine tRNA methylthiotransferase MtaB